MSNSPHRSFERIRRRDLERLAELANADFDALFRRAVSGVYAGRCFLMCLCQGAAEHYVRGEHGVQDFDVWAFFRPHPLMPFPYRRRGTVDFGPSRFGRNPDDAARFKGRRVDVMGRSIPAVSGETGVETVRRYLRQKKGWRWPNRTTQ